MMSLYIFGRYLWKHNTSDVIMWRNKVNLITRMFYKCEIFTLTKFNSELAKWKNDVIMTFHLEAVNSKILIFLDFWARNYDFWVCIYHMWRRKQNWYQIVNWRFSILRKCYHFHKISELASRVNDVIVATFMN